MEKQTEKQLTLRMSQDLHEQIKKSAIKNKRSINAHALWILEIYITTEQQSDESTEKN